MTNAPDDQILIFKRRKRAVQAACGNRFLCVSAGKHNLYIVLKHPATYQDFEAMRVTVCDVAGHAVQGLRVSDMLGNRS